MSNLFKKYGLGWLPDYPDIRDLQPETSEISVMLKTMKVSESSKLKIASSVNLSDSCSEIEDQGDLGSCTAHAGVGMLEYYEKRAFGNHIDASRLFLYKVTRNLLGWVGDTGAFIRTTMGAMSLFGVVPEKYWPYNIPDFDNEPTPFCYSFAQNYQALKYYRLDTTGINKNALLNRVRLYLAAGLPSMFGFTVYNSIYDPVHPGEIPFPTSSESVLGGHAVMAVGYDDDKEIKNPKLGGITTTGAILIRNSWGKSWGKKGYGWLPYEYILQDLAIDWWSLIKNEWVNTKKFGF